MTLNISIQIEPSETLPVKLLQETAKYLLALSGASVVMVPETVTQLISSNETIPDHKLENDEELDIDGKPWDYKLHTSTKAKNKDGRWKVKRNVEIISQEEVTDSLVKEPISVPPPPPPEDLLAKFMGKITERIVSGKMNHNALSVFLRENGIPDVPSIQNFPQLLPDLIKKIEVLP